MRSTIESTAVAIGVMLVAACSSAHDPEPKQLSGPTLNHVLSTGQSNSIGFAATPSLSHVQPGKNLMFDVGVMTSRDCDADGCRVYDTPSALVPLVEGDRYYDAEVETMSSGFANAVSAAADAAGARHDIFVSVHGRSGNVYECLRKGGCPFQAGKGYVVPFEDALRQVGDAMRLAHASDRPLVVRAVTTIHGESDHYDVSFPIDGTDGSPGAIRNYADALVEWQRDYEEAVRAITRQSEAIPLLVSQMNNWNDRPHSDIPLRQLEAHTQAASRVVLVGPTYMLPFAGDCIHYTNEGERRLGEYFAKAYRKIVLDAGTWEPLRPLEIKAAGSAVTVRFSVPRPPLVIDTTQVKDPGAFGFEVVDAGGASIAITEVVVDAADTVRITLERALAGAGRLRYAATATPMTCPGPTTGPRGNLRDSDDTASQNGYDLANWAVAFDLPIDAP